MPLSAFSVDELLNELIKRNPWLNRKQTSRYIDVEPGTLSARDSRKSHDLRSYKDGKHGRRKYRFSDIEEYLRRQQCPG